MQIAYGLEDPRDGLFHYVGITDDVYTRFVAHIRGSGGNIEKNSWIFECRQANIMIAMRELERIELSPKDIELAKALEREKHWIKYYLDLGHPLTNSRIDLAILRERTRLEFLTKDSSNGGWEESGVTIDDVEPVHDARLAHIQQILVAFPHASCSQVAKLARCGKTTAHRYIHEIRDIEVGERL